MDEKLKFQQVLEALSGFGLLLASDPKLPSVTTLITGESIRGSWWGHSQGHTIFRILEQLSSYPDVTTAKLIAGKVTLIHRTLWPALLGVATACDSWQTRNLSPKARELLETLAKEDSLRMDQVDKSLGTKPLNEAVREIERRLLAYSESVHTSGGAHAKQLETWKRWAIRAMFAGNALSSDEGRKKLEEALVTMTGDAKTVDLLPWNTAAVGRKVRISQPHSPRRRSGVTKGDSA